MGRDNDVGGCPKWVAWGEWFGVSHIHNGTCQVSALDRLNQMISHDNGAPGHVYKQTTRFICAKS